MSSLRRFRWLFAAGALYIVDLLFEPSWGDGPAILLTVATTAAVVLFTAERVASREAGLFSPEVMLGIALFAWHFSFLVVYSLGLASWYRIPAYFDMAPQANMRGLLSCSYGVLAFLGGVEVANRPSDVCIKCRSSAFLRIGVGACIVGGLLAAGYFAVRGVGLVGEYERVFLESDPLRRAYNLGVTLSLSGLTMVLVSSRRTRFPLIAGLAGVGTVAFLGLLMGSRWVTLMAAVAFCAGWVWSGNRIRVAPALVGLLLAFSVAFIVKDSRSRGSDGLSLSILDRETTPIIELFEEVGQAYRAVVGTVDLYSRRDFEYGRTFALAATSVIPSSGGLVDPNVARPNEMISAEFFWERFRSRGFTIGYSIIAELFMNGGGLAVVIGMLMFGILVGVLTTQAQAGRAWASLIMIYGTAIMIFGVRNDMMTWFRQLVWGTLFVLLVLAVFEHKVPFSRRLAS